MHDIAYYDSPLGRILLAADEQGLIGLWFEEQKYFAAGLAEGSGRFCSKFPMGRSEPMAILRRKSPGGAGKIVFPHRPWAARWGTTASRS